MALSDRFVTHEVRLGDVVPVNQVTSMENNQTLDLFGVIYFRVDYEVEWFSINMLEKLLHGFHDA